MRTPLLLLVLTLSLSWGCGPSQTETDRTSGDRPAQPIATEAADPAEAWADLLPNARQPMADLVSGGQPSPEQLETASASGYKTVINLRMPGEPGTDTEAELVEDLGMRYVSLPIDGADGMTEENARALAEALDSAERPALLHCGSGNRVGALLALRAFYVDGAEAEKAVQYGLDAGMTRLENAVREHLEAASSP